MILLEVALGVIIGLLSTIGILLIGIMWLLQVPPKRKRKS